ncbi:MAG TPA: hypothetical protein VMH86_01330 [Rhizomicrobium sp.]|nr:hypothetical protein [Rhizomicrobium sp.]
MAAKAQAKSRAATRTRARPIMTDDGIAAKTGHGWEEWFARLDKAGAARLDHKAIAALLDKKWKPGPWWGQMIAVSYERARGIRAMNQKCDGEFSVGVTKVFPVPLGKLFTVVGDARRWPEWMPKGAFEETSRTRDKYLRARWKTDARISVGFYAKGADKAQVAFDIGKLPDGEAVEAERAAWKKAVEKLGTLLG